MLIGRPPSGKFGSGYEKLARKDQLNARFGLADCNVRRRSISISAN